MSDDSVDPKGSLRLDSVEQAISDIAAGKAVVVVDDEDRENEGDLIFAAELATPELVAFMVRYSSGYICAPLTSADCDRLDLPPMVANNEDTRHTAYTVTVDAATGSTGISATSRCETIRRLADPSTGRKDFTRPGHVVPLRAVAGGVLARDGHTEASIDLTRLAGLRPAGVLCEIVSEEDPTDMARGPELRRFADEHGLSMISIEQLIAYRRRTERQVKRVVETRMPTSFGYFRMYGYEHSIHNNDLVALVVGDVTSADEVLVRIHSECLTGDVFGSHRCDCGPQLHESMRLVQEAGRGIIIYLRGHEGRGIGLLSKLKAYRLQDSGLDTVDANLEQGLPADSREYSAAGQILDDLGVTSLSLLTNNPAKCSALAELGVEVVGRVPVLVEPNRENIRYLRTKRDRMGHDLPALDQWDADHPEGEPK
nr:bifunctional 3,4-dihydroxy-2-butanone-4-phosphate synthase/GTP cyclohydrolase II [Corynebacterium alimapuense]